MNGDFNSKRPWPVGIGENEENMTINLGDSLMSIEVIQLAQKIAADRKTHTVEELCTKYSKKRAQINTFIYAVEKLPLALRWFYIQGVVGLKPVVELHKEYGDKVLPVIKRIYNEKREKNDNAGIKKPQILRELGVEPVVTKKTNSTGVGSEKIDEDLNISRVALNECLNSVHEIHSTLENAARQNLNANGFNISVNMYERILNQLHLIEEFLDEGDDNPRPKNTTKIQSKCSYVIEDELQFQASYDPQIDYENMSQDPNPTDYENMSQDPNPKDY